MTKEVHPLQVILHPIPMASVTRVGFSY